MTDEFIDIDVEIETEENIDLDVDIHDEQIETDIELSTSGTNDYNDLINKPSINGIELIGDKTPEELDILPLTNAEIDEFMNS
ncbi:MAG: hypothetical protein K5752_04410 [Succinivibrionaceae bacterium]|nr:hypothetical protein [Succinivibrionaceae bacterium]